MDEATWLSTLAQYEEKIQFSTPSPRGASPFVYKRGNLPVLISAPHSTIHLRNGRSKRADGFTGAFAHLLHHLTGAHALYANYRLAADPNWDKYSPYKSLLRRVVTQNEVRFVLDLHGMSNWTKFGLALGTINGRSCPTNLPIIQHTLAQHQFTQISHAQAKAQHTLDWRTFVVDHPRFTGGVSSHTVTRFVSEQLGIEAVQLEICASMRVVFQNFRQKKLKEDGAATVTLINALTALIKTV